MDLLGQDHRIRKEQSWLDPLVAVDAWWNSEVIGSGTAVCLHFPLGQTPACAGAARQPSKEPHLSGTLGPLRPGAPKG